MHLSKKSTTLIIFLAILCLGLISTKIILAAKSNSTLKTATSTLYQFPEPFVYNGVDAGTKLVDLDNDGYVDIVRSYQSPAETIKRVYFNDRKGGWVLNPDYIVPIFFFKIDQYNQQYLGQGTELVDVDGDGLVDIFQSYGYKSGGCFVNGVYINIGKAPGWVLDPDYTSIPCVGVIETSAPNPFRFVDINVDGLIDIVEVTDIRGNPNTPNMHQKIWFNKGDGTGWTDSM